MFKSLKIQATSLANMEYISEWLYSVARLGSVALDEDILSMPPMITIANRFVLPVQSAALTPEFTEMVADELERDNLWTDSSIELILSSTANRQIRRVFSYSETMNETIPIKEWWSPDWEGPRVVRHEDREYLRIRGTGNIKLNAFLYAFARLLPIDQDLEIIPERIDEGNEDVMIGNALYLKASKRTEQFSRLSVDDEIKLSLQATLLQDLLRSLPEETVRHICLKVVSHSIGTDALNVLLCWYPANKFERDNPKIYEKVANDLMEQILSDTFLSSDVRNSVTRAIKDALIHFEKLHKK